MTNIAAHGGHLINQYQPDLDLSGITKEVELDATSLSDLELIATGAFSPLTGFLTEKDYNLVVKDMRLANGTVWSLPITLPVTDASDYAVCDAVLLKQEGIVYAQCV